MKTHIIVFAVVLLCTSQINAMSEEMEDLMKMLRNTCTEETGADGGLVDKAKAGDWSDDEKFKCYIKCIMDQMSVISDDGIIDSDAIAEMMPPEIKDKAAPVIKSCGTKVGASPCENAWLTFQCYQKGMGSDFFLP